MPRWPLLPGLLGVGVGLIAIAFGSGGLKAKNGTLLLGLTLILLVFTIAELLLSPIGLSLSTKLAPEKFRTQMVALFFFSIALGTVLAGNWLTTTQQATSVPILGSSASSRSSLASYLPRSPSPSTPSWAT